MSILFVRKGSRSARGTSRGGEMADGCTLVSISEWGGGIQTLNREGGFGAVLRRERGGEKR